MNETVAMTMLLLTAMLAIYLIGNALINSYFSRKEEFVDKIQEKVVKGATDGKSK